MLSRWWCLSQLFAYLDLLLQYACLKKRIMVLVILLCVLLGASSGLSYEGGWPTGWAWCAHHSETPCQLVYSEIVSLLWCLRKWDACYIFCPICACLGLMSLAALGLLLSWHIVVLADVIRSVGILQAWFSLQSGYMNIPDVRWVLSFFLYNFVSFLRAVVWV